MSNRLAEIPEVFDPSTETFSVLPMIGAVGRASHTATLLTEGTVLIAGGSSGGAAPLQTEIWDIPQQRAIPSAGPIDRVGHEAVLMADGRVQITGGTSVTGERIPSAIVINSVTGTIDVPADAGRTNPRRPPTQVATSIPANHAGDVPRVGALTLRFSDAVRATTLNAQTIVLRSERAQTPLRIVVAEHGRLAFVWPSDALEEATTYVLTIAGALDLVGTPVISTSISFTTEARPVEPAAPDAEDWTPDLSRGEAGWRTGRPPSPWQSLPPLRAPTGVTALAGQVLTLDGRPLPDVTLELEDDTASVRTDRTGRFLLRPQTTGGGRRVLVIDGASASRPDRTYGLFEYGLELAAGETTVLRFTIWMPKLDTRHQVTIPSPTPRETVVTTPLIRGLELHLPAGTVVRDHEGAVVRTVSITPIPLDRTPFPLPEDATFRMFFTIQPGGAYLYTPGPIRGGWLVYPNVSDGPIGKRVQFINYDPTNNGWHVYGMGTVAPRQVVPDARTRIYGFTGASFNDGQTAPPAGPTPDGPTEGDPVDPSTGTFVMEKTDLYIPDLMPLTLTRTYNSKDPYQRPFGTGMMHPYAVFQHSEDLYDEADLILPNGAKIHYVRISASGLPYWQTVFEHTSSPTVFYKSTISWNGQYGWDLKLMDGTVYVFGFQAPLQKIRDQYGNEIRLTWSGTNAYSQGNGNILRVTSPSGRWIAFSYYSGTSRISQATDNIGRTVAYTYDAAGNLSTVTDPSGAITMYTWDASNRLLSIEDGRDIVYLTNEYTNGRVTKQTLPGGATYQFAYTVDGSGNITQTDVTNPRGYVKRLTFNADRHVTAVTEAYGTALARTTTFTRQSGSNFVTAAVDPLSRRTEWTHDSNSGRVLTEKRLAGTADEVTTTYTYEPLFKQLATITDPLNHTWTIGYDSAGRITSVTDPLSHQTTINMNGLGQVTSITDPLQHTTQLSYFGGDLRSITDPLGNTATRFVDGAGRQIFITDPLGRTTQTTYDAVNRVTRITDPLGGETDFTYDANGNLLTLTDARDNTTTYTYDNMDLVATRTDPLTRQETYTYDNNGNLTLVTDRKSQDTAFTYDALDRLTLTTYEDASTTEYSHDGGDRLIEVDDSVAGVITRDWDDLDQLIEEDTPEGLVTYTYDDAGRRSTMSVSGQSQISYTYDNANRLTGITQGTASVSFAYDDANRRTSLTLPNGIVTTYTYDNANQLTGLAYALGGTPLGDLTYTYDAAGNRLSTGGSWARTNLPAAVASATYNAANQIATLGGTTFTYDNNGNLTNDGSRTYTWSARNQLSALSGSMTASFAYDGFGRRRAKTVSGTTGQFLYDGLNLVQELASGTPTANLLTGLAIDEMFTRTPASGTEHFLVDALGSTVALSNGTGTVQTEYSYEPFGRTTTTGTGTTNSIAFTGRENDGTGLLAYRARFYSPTLQRFVSEDPLGFAAGDANLHSYVANQPTMWRDPSGLLPVYLPPGHPCRWPPDDEDAASRTSDAPVPEPPLSWYLMCSPAVAPDLIPIPLARPGGTGWPRTTGIQFHARPHPFPFIGLQPHIQINIWFDGIPGISIPIRIPVPRGPWW